MENLTPSQQRAVAARGNVLVMAGAGTGKTNTQSHYTFPSSRINADR